MKQGSKASRTAVLVCQARAVADGRLATERFSDPTAARLLREDEGRAVLQAREDTKPSSAGPRIRWELLRATAEVLVPRTIAIDDAVRACGHAQVVILGAGLDGRAWRMPELADTAVFEVDHPASQDDKRQRAADLTPVTEDLRFVPVDFARDALDTALAEAGHDPAVPTTWVWEGVVSYLERSDVLATMDIVRRLSAPGSRLVINYQAPSKSAAIGRFVLGAISTLTRQDNFWAGEPTRSTWTAADMDIALVEHGFEVVSDDDLLSLMGNLDAAPQQSSSLSNGRVVVADRVS
jgi:methyltransferase (TIGR00027 family)